MIDFNLGQERWFELTPVDAWFFRDGRPSNWGEDQSDLESQFPPNASTVVGAIRAALARSQGWDGHGSWATDAKLKAVLGDGFDDLGQLSSVGPLLKHGSDILWPMPRHVVGRHVEACVEDGRVQTRFNPLGLLEPSREPVICDAGHVRLPQWTNPLGSATEDKSCNKLPEPPSGVFVTTAGMSRILSGQRPEPKDCRCSTELFQHESRVGIRRDDDSRTTGQNAMYSPRYVRLRKGVSVLVGVRGLPDAWAPPSLVPFGGESRMARIDRLHTPPDFPMGQTVGEYRLAITATPTRFSDPWWGPGPNNDARKLSPTLSGRIITVMLDRPQQIGGWNTIAGCPLPLCPFVAPGTVWWIESTHPATGGCLQLGESIGYGYGLAFISSHQTI